jgi:hypothetical protein
LFQVLSGNHSRINIDIGTERRSAVIEPEHELILSMLKYRLFTPIEIIIDRIFHGDAESAYKSINDMIENKLIQCAVDDRITITTAGKMSILKNSGNVKRY